MNTWAFLLGFIIKNYKNEQMSLKVSAILIECCNNGHKVTN